jgi:hypothetical protein
VPARHSLQRLADLIERQYRLDLARADKLLWLVTGASKHTSRSWPTGRGWPGRWPLLDRPSGVRPCPRGSWGPDDAETLVHGHPRWQQPWLPADR